MTETVPDDVLEYILHYALTIPAETFEAWRTPATFAGSPRSNVSDILLVSTRWHNLGVPSLYEAAILRTVDQGRLFAHSAKIMNERGVRRSRYLRRLRIEGGYSTHTKMILEESSGITTLFIAFDISLDDSAAGLKRALRKVNPLRLFLYSSPGSHATASNTRSLYAAVGVAMPCWTKLKRIDASPEFIFQTPLIPPLSHLPALEFVSMTNYTATMSVELVALEALFDNPAVKVIQIRDGINWLKWRGTSAVLNAYPRDKILLGEGINMIPWQEFPPNDAMVPATTRCLNLPDLPDKIWTRILGFATHVHGYNFLDVDGALVDLSKRCSINSTRMNVLLVNKLFHRLGLQYLYAIPHITSDQMAAGFAARVESSKQLASFVRALYVRDEIFLRAELCIRAPLVNLVRLKARIQVLLELGKHVPAGASTRLQWATQTLSPFTGVTPRVFSTFPHLQHLTLYGGRGDDLSNAYPNALPRLESLRFHTPGPNMFSVFACMDLPNLRELGFTVADDEADDLVEFLEKHGAKLETISLASADATLPKYPPILDYCPNITELKVDCPELPQTMPIFVVSAAPHSALKRLTFSNPALWIREYVPTDGVKRWDAFVEFLVVHRHKVPVLEEVRTLSRFEWPMHEHAYRFSFATTAAFDLHEIGIALADKDGTRWTRFRPEPFRQSRRGRRNAGGLNIFGTNAR
ncbi:hypothetical protein GY45DRAFT_1320990 [Cubamyces sp. BRFM 1775]|nr:hypothetical protein GY45DRAFT_1320990 [Cubamyces sp. BRFM 1775]